MCHDQFIAPCEKKKENQSLNRAFSMMNFIHRIFQVKFEKEKQQVFNK